MATEQWYQLTLRQVVNGVNVANVFDYRIEDPTEADNTEQLATAFAAGILLRINDVQHDGVSNKELYVLNRTDARYSFLGAIGGGGTVVTAAADLPPQQTSIYVKLTPGNTYDWLTQSEETARPIKRGGKYTSGVPDGAMSDYALDPTWESTAWGVLESSFAANIALGSGDTAIPVVHGDALAITAEDPARPEVYADVISAARRTISFLDSRKE